MDGMPGPGGPQPPPGHGPRSAPDLLVRALPRLRARQLRHPHASIGVIMAYSLVLIGGTGQHFGWTVGSLATLGVVPPPDRVVVIDADTRPEGSEPNAMTEALRESLDLARYSRFAEDEDGDNLPFIEEHPLGNQAAKNLASAYIGDDHLEVFYTHDQAAHSTSEGFHAEPQLGAASYLKEVLLAGQGGSRLREIVGKLTGRVFIVGSVAGGTGAGLWRLVARFVRENQTSADVRLILFGHLFQISNMGEDALPGITGSVNTARLISNTRAGFQQLRYEAQRPPSQRSFSKAYVVGYPPRYPGVLPQNRRHRMLLPASRMTLVASTALQDTADPSEQDPLRVFVYPSPGDAARQDGLFTLRFGARDLATRARLTVPGSPLRAWADAARQAFDDIRAMDFDAGWSSMLRKRRLSKTFTQTVKKHGGAHHQWAQELKSESEVGSRVLDTFARWLADSAANEFPPTPQRQDSDASLIQSPSWQDALNRLGKFVEQDPGKIHLHVRRWLVGIASSQIDWGTAKTPSAPNAGNPVPLAPFEVNNVQKPHGWASVPADAVSIGIPTRSQSYATPMARAHWIADLILWDPASDDAKQLDDAERARIEEQRNRALQEAGLLWSALLAGVLDVEEEELPRIDLQESDSVQGTLLHVISLLEGATLGGRIQWLVFEGRLVGAVHPVLGPFLGNQAIADELLPILQERTGTHSDAVAALARGALGSVDIDGRRPAWHRALQEIESRADAPNLARFARRSLSLRLEGLRDALSVEALEPAREAAVLRLVGSNGSSVASCLPWSANEVKRRLLEEDPAQAVFSPQDDGFFTLLSGQERYFRTREEVLENWNVEVFPGEYAPAETKRFLMAIEPPKVKQRSAARYRLQIAVQRGSDFQVVDVPTEQPQDSGQAAWVSHLAVEGRPRLLIIEDLRNGATGTFPLLSAPTRTRESSATVDVSLDFGTSRSCVALRRDDFTFGGYEAPSHRLVDVQETANVQLSRYRPWVRTLMVGSGLSADTTDLGHAAAKNCRILVAPSALHRRAAPLPASQGIEPLDLFIPGDTPAPRDNTIQAVASETGIKWEGTVDEIEAYVAWLLYLSAVEADWQSDQRNQQAPQSMHIIHSFPLAFSEKRAGDVRAGTQGATQRLEEWTNFSVSSRGNGQVNESKAALAFARGAAEGGFVSTIDIGGGTVDYSIAWVEPGGQAIIPLAVDSVQLGGEAIMRNVAALDPDLQQERQAGMALNALRQRILDVGFYRATTKHMDQAYAKEFVELVREYGSRLLAGVVLRVSSDDWPQWLQADEGTRTAIKRDLAHDATFKLYLVGGGWRILESAFGVQPDDWRNDSPQLAKHVRSPIESSIRELLGDAGREISIYPQASMLDVPGKEKAAVAVGAFVTSDGNGDMLFADGLRTFNGMGENGRGHDEVPWTQEVGGDEAPEIPLGTRLIALPELTRQAKELHLREWTFGRAIEEDRNSHLISEALNRREQDGARVALRAARDRHGRRQRSALSIVYEAFFGQRLKARG
ncbi:MAG: hypothetical protein ACQEXJ_21075 [Myxococcota bacterium]